MAQKRMFSLSVTDTDTFLDLPASAQALYFHLGMHGDDDGFVDCPKKILRNVGANKDDMMCLIGKGYLIPFESGVVVIRDWKINNTIQADRKHPTVYQDEMRHLQLDEARRYCLTDAVDTSCIQPVSKTETEYRLDKSSRGEKTIAQRPPAFTPPTVDEVRAYCDERGNNVDPANFVDFYTARGWKLTKGVPMKEWRAAVRTWEKRERKGAEDEPERWY